MTPSNPLNLRSGKVAPKSGVGTRRISTVRPALQRVDHLRAGTRTRTTRVVSPGREGCYVEWVLALSPTGRRELFECDRTLFVRDLATGRTVVGNPGLGGQPAADSVSRAAFSDDGRTVVFCTQAKNLAPGHGPDDDVILRDLRRRTTSVLAHAGNAIGCTGTIAVSGNGRSALFRGDAPGNCPQRRA